MIITIFAGGKSDAVLFESEAGNFMIDTGLERRSEDLLKQLKEKGITSLKALIITHFDKDHVGGAACLIRHLQVDRVYTTYPSPTGADVHAFQKAVKQKKTLVEEIRGEKELRIGAVRVQITGASMNYKASLDNNSSLIAMVTFGTQKYLFTGDAEDERLAEYFGNHDVRADFLKVPNHGRCGAMTPQLFAECAPVYAVITCGHGVPVREEIAATEELLEINGIEYFETKDGNVILNCRETEFTIRQEKKRKE